MKRTQGLDVNIKGQLIRWSLGLTRKSKRCGGELDEEEEIKYRLIVL